MSKFQNVQIYSKSINIVNTPDGLAVASLQIQGGDRIGRISYGEEKKGVFVKFTSPSMLFNENGEKILIELDTRQFEEWTQFFDSLQTKMPEEWPQNAEDFVSPIKEIEGKHFLQVKIIKPDIWTPELKCSSISLSMFAWRFDENTGVSFNLFPPSTRKSGNKRARTETDSKESSEK